MPLKKKSRVWVDSELVDSVQERVPETNGMTMTGLVDFAMRRLISRHAKPLFIRRRPYVHRKKNGEATNNETINPT